MDWRSSQKFIKNGHRMPYFHVVENDILVAGWLTGQTVLLRLLEVTETESWDTVSVSGILVSHSSSGHAMIIQIPEHETQMSWN